MFNVHRTDETNTVHVYAYVYTCTVCAAAISGTTDYSIIMYNKLWTYMYMYSQRVQFYIQLSS